MGEEKPGAAMKKRVISVSRAVVCNLVILILVAASVTVLVPGAGAETPDNAFFNLAGVRDFTDHLFMQPSLQPPSFGPGNSLPRGYYTGDGCPVGTDGAPYPIQPLMTSGALCRGACGPDCPAGRCKNEQMKILKNREGTGTCMYTNIITCPTHPGCQEHDACYDWCEDYGYTFMMDSCHRICNDRCAADYGTFTCIPWADLPGSFAGATKPFDWGITPSYSGTLTFSDNPRFTAYEIPLSPPSPTPTPAPARPTVVPATTPSPTVTTGEDARLTILMTGLSAEDLEGTTIGWSPEALSESCSPTAAGASCNLKFRYGIPVELSVYPSSGVRFTGWSGSCSGSGDCTTSMTKDKTVTAQFSKIPATTTITSYQDYCTENYPGSLYDRDTESCVFNRPSPTTTPGYGTGGDLVLIPLAGGCCPNEPCTTQIATATGGTPPYTFTSGSLADAPPIGMIIDINGYLTGTAPPEMKTFSFGVCVKDLAGLSKCGTSAMTVS